MLIYNKCVSRLTVSLSIDRALIEAHDVLSESSSFVTEDVFNLRETIKMGKMGWEWRSASSEYS